MIVCRLCGLTIEAIPEDAVLIGRLHRFADGSFHFLRKKLEPRTGPRPRKKTGTNPDHEPPISNVCEQREEVLTPEFASEVPTPVATPIIPANAILTNETAMERAFRLKKVA
jgi:hypothetical protein